MKKSNWTKTDYRYATFLAIWPKLMLGIIILIGIIVWFYDNSKLSIDHSINKKREIIGHVIVTDSTYNGFRIVYASNEDITKERLQEIRSRESLKKGYTQLQREAPVYFGSMLHTDIYDFAEFVLRYEIDKDLQLHNIFIYGVEKCNLYIGPNPKIQNPAKYFHFGTEQGAQYINREDIFRSNGSEKIYRYWKCQGIHSISTKDERFSHFSEEQRIW